MKVNGPDGEERIFEKDETVRPETSMEALGGLKTVFGTKVITAGNSSPITDGASAILIMSGAKAKELGVSPRARVVTNAVAGADAVMMLTGPIPATERVLASRSETPRHRRSRDQRGICIVPWRGDGNTILTGKR